MTSANTAHHDQLDAAPQPNLFLQLYCGDAADSISSETLKNKSEPWQTTDNETPETDASLVTSAPAGTALVQELMKRQDEALSELDALNARVESFIAEISASRKNQILDEFCETESSIADSHRAA